MKALEQESNTPFKFFWLFRDPAKIDGVLYYEVPYGVWCAFDPTSHNTIVLNWAWSDPQLAEAEIRVRSV